MKLKIIILMILMIISINNVNCESGNGSIETYISSSNDYTLSRDGNNLYTDNFLLKLNHDTGGIPDSYSIKNIHARNLTNYSSTPGNLGDPFYIWYSSDGITKTECIGYGSVRIYKKSIYDGETFNIDIYFTFDNINIDTELSGTQYYILDGTWSSIYSHYNLYYDGPSDYQVYPNINAHIGGTLGRMLVKKIWGSSTHEYTSLGIFRNDYEYNVTSSFFDVDIQRIGFDETYQLKSSNIKMLNYSDDTIYYNPSPTAINSSHFLTVGTYNYYIVRQIDDYHHLIYTSYEDDEDDEDEQPTLNTDKTYYNTSEIIEISFTNINTIYDNCYESKCAKPYDLHILYPVTDEYKDYETKYIYPLTYNLEDETIYLNTSFLSPQNNYILGIVGINGDYTQHEDILIFSNDFVVYPDDEYLSVSCDSESECYTYNNADITIYYSILNNSNIIIKDNDNNIINTYYNIIGNGSILYNIPDDLYHVNTYPNWKVFLNNTEYSTSFNKGVIVYWSQFQTPTPTPIFTPQPTPDINISDTVDEFKTEIEPIKQLLFGLTEIVIDNPDYNKDNIVDENEINHWFNSLISICIVLLLVIVYIGLKKKRN